MNDVIAAIDVKCLAVDRLSCVCRETGDGGADICDRHQAARRGFRLSPLQQSIQRAYASHDTGFTLEALEPSPRYRRDISGEIEYVKETKEKLFAGLPRCRIIVVLLVWQFNIFRRPAIVVPTIPMASPRLWSAPSLSVRLSISSRLLVY
jgi:Cu/Ag efflux pump CusA